jgi:hypothetical protein
MDNKLVALLRKKRASAISSARRIGWDKKCSIDQWGNNGLMQMATCSAPLNSPNIRRTSEFSEAIAKFGKSRALTLDQVDRRHE